MKNLKNKFDFLEKKVGKEPPFGVLPVYYPERIKGKKLIISREYVLAMEGDVTVGVEGEPLILDMEVEVENRNTGRMLYFLVIEGSLVTIKRGFSLYAPETTVYVWAENTVLEEGTHFSVGGIKFKGNMEKFPDNFTASELELPSGLKELPRGLNVVEELTVPFDFWKHIEGMNQDGWARLPDNKREELVRLELEEKRSGFIGKIYFIIKDN